MATIKISPAEVWGEYEQAVSYNQSDPVNLYETVKQNENFFIGRQWEGVQAPDLDKPVLNILKRVVNYFISTIVSDDVTAQVSLFSGEPDEEADVLLKAVSAEFDAVIERCGIKSRNRSCLRNAAVDGDACLHLWFDASDTRGGTISGNIEAEELDNTNVLFGNPQMWEVQKQPYIILVMRKTVEAVRDEARQNGRPQSEIEAITADDDPNGVNLERETGKVTELLKYWKQDGTIWCEKVTQNVVVKPPVNLGYKLYPVAWFSWDRVKNAYHGQSCITGLIPNQIFINKLFAMCMEHVKRMAFPKVAYNASRLPRGWSNRVGEAIPVQGEPGQNIAEIIGGADMSNQVIMLIEKIIDYTRDTMGASDAALGNVRPDNTSAIIAVQKASESPLTLQRMDFYQFVEDYIRIMMDMMRVDYGLRTVGITDSEGNAQVADVDFSALEGLALKLNVDVGASAYWSEVMQVQTNDNLFERQILTDPVMYLENIPDGYVRNKQRLIARLKERDDMSAQVEQMQAVIAELQGQLQSITGGGAADAVPGMPYPNAL